MSDLVAKHLRRWATTEFEWGVADCSIVLADYVLDAVGIDGAAHIRARYHDALSCRRLTKGDLLAVVAQCARIAGLDPAYDLKRGDIGVIVAGKHQVGALHLGDNRWAVKSTDGLLTLSIPPVIAAWAVRG